MNPTYQAIDNHLRPKRKPVGERAIDIWWFIRPSETREPPIPLPGPEDLTNPIIRVKPNSEFLACRMCLCIEKPVWQTWKNTDGGVTTNIRAHLLSKHGPSYKTALEHAEIGLKSSFSSEDEDFSLETWIDLLADFMVVDDQAMNLVECAEFRRFVLYGRKGVQDKDLPHRTAITDHIYRQYLEDYDELVKELKASLGRVSFTSDIWSDPMLAGFLAMTAHYCRRNPAGGIEIANRLLAFRLVEGAHDGENIGQIMYDIIKDAGVHRKIGQITLDNASNCDTAMQKIERCCAMDGIAFDSDGNHCRCFPHIINITAQTITKELKEHPKVVVDGALAANPHWASDPEKMEHLAEYEKAVEGDPVGKSRGLVSACRASGQRRADFRQIIISGNEADKWTLPVVQLLRDVETRWSALFLMVGRVLDLAKAIQFFLDLPKHEALANHRLSTLEFQVLTDLHQILQLPHAAQELLSAEKTPTLCFALPAFEILVDSLLQKQKAIPELSHYIGVGITKIIEYSRKCRKSRIYAIAMILNPAYKFEWIKCHWTTNEAEDARTWMLETMTAFATSKRKAAEAAATLLASSTLHVSARRTSTLPSAQASESIARGMNKLISLQSGASSRRCFDGSQTPTEAESRASTPALSPRPLSPAPLPEVQPPRQPTTEEMEELEHSKTEKDKAIAREELDSYLLSPLESSDLNGVSLVRYWDVNELKYPLLFRVALDVLPAQASAVPCERVFSSSKRSCEDHRNRTAPKLFEALQFRKHRLKQTRLDFTGKHDVAKEIDYTIEGQVTDHAARELLSQGKIAILEDLLNNSRESPL